VKAREFATIAEKGIKKHENSGRIHVTPQLHTQTYPNVYVAGDQAWVERIDTDQPYPMRAQFAVRQGRQAAKNVLANVRGNSEAPFHWNDKGIVISAGHGRTYAEVLGVKFSGLPATIVYKLVYLNSMIGFRQRARAILEWTLNMFLPRDISEL
jgi:NADH dehydrogenase